MKTFEVVEKDGSTSKVEAEFYRIRGDKLAFFVKNSAVYQYDKDTVEKVIEDGASPMTTKIG